MMKRLFLGLVAVSATTLGACAVAPEGSGAAEDVSALSLTPTYCRMACPVTPGGPSKGRVTGVRWSGAAFEIAEEAIINGDTSVADFGSLASSADFAAALALRGIFAADADAATRAARVTSLRAALDAHRSGCKDWHVSSFGNTSQGNQVLGFTCKDDIPAAHCAPGSASAPASLACPAPAAQNHAWCVALKPVNVASDAKDANVVGYGTCGANYRKVSESGGVAEVWVNDANTLRSSTGSSMGVGATVYTPSAGLTCFADDGTESFGAWLQEMDGILASVCHSRALTISRIPEAPTKAAAMKGVPFTAGIFSEGYLNQRENAFEFWGRAASAGRYYCNANRAGGATVNVWTQNLNAGDAFYCAFYAPGASFIAARD
jgi:hypothetical protein